LDCGIRPHQSPCERPMKRAKSVSSPTLLKARSTLIFSVNGAHGHPNPKNIEEDPEINGGRISLTAVIKRPGQPINPYRAKPTQSLLDRHGLSASGHPDGQCRTSLPRAERPIRLHLESPSRPANACGPPHAHRSSAPPESKLIAVTVKQLVHMGKQQAVGTAEPLAVVRIPPGLNVARHRKLLSPLAP